jgi:hypothetical protein
MPTKFVVLWLQTVFITGNGNAVEDNELVLQSENISSLEEALKFYNTKIADDTVQQVMILVPLKDFNRSIK